MMYHGTLLLAAAVTFKTATAQYIQWGPYLSMGATQNHIIEAETTLYPGKPPSPEHNRLALWPGMGTDTNDLIQTIILSGNDDVASNCGGKPHVVGEWCVFASTLQDGVQVYGQAYPLTATQGVTINYKYDETTTNTTQTVTIEGKVVSELSTKSGRALGWGTAVECQDQCQGLVNAQTYNNTVIILADVDDKFAGTVGRNQATGVVTTEDNKTFKIDVIDVPAYVFAAAPSAAATTTTSSVVASSTSDADADDDGAEDC